MLPEKVRAYSDRGEGMGSSDGGGRRMVKPSEHIDAILSGELRPEDTPPAIQSWLQFICYRIAVDLQSLTREQQRERARQYPDAVLEIIRAWYRVAQKKGA